MICPEYACYLCTIYPYNVGRLVQEFCLKGFRFSIATEKNRQGKPKALRDDIRIFRMNAQKDGTRTPNVTSDRRNHLTTMAIGMWHPGCKGIGYPGGAVILSLFNHHHPS